MYCGNITTISFSMGTSFHSILFLKLMVVFSDPSSPHILLLSGTNISNFIMSTTFLCTLNCLKITGQITKWSIYLLNIVANIITLEVSISICDHHISSQHFKGGSLASTIVAKQTKAFLIGDSYTDVIHSDKISKTLVQVYQEERVCTFTKEKKWYIKNLHSKRETL